VTTTRTLILAVAASLALPVLALAAMIGQQEYRAFDAPVMQVSVRGVDPRDLLQGHYLVATFDWDWQPAPEASGTGGLCVMSTSGERSRPSVRFIEGWQPGSAPAEGCQLMIFGNARGKRDGAGAAFVPANLDIGYFTVHLFVSETRAPELEDVIRKRPDALTVDLAVRADGSAVVRRLRLGGQPLNR